MDQKKGMFIAFEGIDGCGKSTQIKKFVEYLFHLNKHNHIILTREPYKEVKVREILNASADPLTQSEQLAELFIEDRKAHVKELIIPSLDKGHHVITDRYKLSTIAYQTAQGLPQAALINLQREFPVPDITFIVDLPAQVSADRMKKEARSQHKFEANIEFMEKVRNQFLNLPQTLKNEKIIIIDGRKSIEEVFSGIRQSFEKQFLPTQVKKKYESMDEVPEYIKEKLAKFFTNVGGDTFGISGLPPELTGGALARYSRAPTGMQLTIINEFLDDAGEPSQQKGSELMDRVLNAYGDDSVGELEGTHVGIENVSQLLTKTIEDRRIGGSPIEQSTRYVKYDQKDKDGRWRYLRPKEIIDSPLAEKYEQINNMAFEIYSEGVKRLIEYFKQKLPEDKFQIDVERNGVKIKVSKPALQGEAEEKAFRIAYNFTVRCGALDVGRCVLPSSTLTHLGIYGNGRFFTSLITALKSGELEEEKLRGEALEAELKKIIPTFIKRNKADPEIAARNTRMRELASKILPQISPAVDKVTLMAKDEFLTELISASLFPYTSISLPQIAQEVRNMSYKEKMDIFNHYIGVRNARRDRSGRGFEAGYPLTFDLVGGFAEYRDLERHRMLTQQRQLLTTDLGFIMPPEMVEVGLEKEVEVLVMQMQDLNQQLRKLGLVAASQYATLFNHRMRFTLGMNLREFQHLSELRTQTAGHFSYRAMVMEMARKVQQQYPWASKAYQFVDYSDPDNKISRAQEQSRIAGKNLSKGVDSGIDYN